MALHRLRGRPAEDYRAVLGVEQRRRRPRKLLCALLTERLARLQDVAYGVVMTPDEIAARGGQPGNTNAAKEDGLDGQQTLRVKKSEIKGWKAEAARQGIGYTTWVRKVLNKAAGLPPPV